MKRNIILIGPSRVGKTTLAKRLNMELNYSVLGTDDLAEAFKESLPQLKIGKPNDYETSVANVAPFLATYVSALAWRSNYYNGTKFVFEDGQGWFDFNKLVPLWEAGEPNKDYWKKQYLIIGLTYHNQTPDELFNKIREHDVKDDWTYRASDEKLRSHIDSCLEYSRTLYDKCKKYGPIFYDVSNDREQVLDKIFNDIVNQVEKKHPIV